MGGCPPRLASHGVPVIFWRQGRKVALRRLSDRPQCCRTEAHKIMCAVSIA